MWLIVWLGACGQADRDLVERRAALDGWRAGVAAHDAGQFDAAATAFATARSHRPGDGLLAAWQARSLAAHGDLQGALSALDEALELDPALHHARYNRAAIRARLGDVEGAASDLRAAIAGGAVRARDVLQDPDFSPHADHPAMAFLPVESLQIAVEVPSQTLFWGTDFPIRLRVGGAGDLPLSITAEALTGPIQLMRVVEDAMRSTAGPMRDLTWTWRVTGGGGARLGPLHVWAGSRRSTVDAVEVATAAPEDRAHAPLGPQDLATPHELAVGHQPPTAWWVGTELRVMSGPGDAVSVDPRPSHIVPYELRDQGQTVWRLDRMFDASPDATVRIDRVGQPVFDGRPEAEP